MIEIDETPPSGETGTTDPVAGVHPEALPGVDASPAVDPVQPATAPKVSNKKSKKLKGKTEASGSASAVSGDPDSGGVNRGGRGDASAATYGRRRNTGLSFFTSKNSIFSDGYDLEAERLRVASVIRRVESGEDILGSDPLFDHFMLYQDRAAEYAKAGKQRQVYAEQAQQVTRRETQAYKALGALVNDADEEDSILLHTKEAFQLFIGRAIDPDGGSGSSGGSGASDSKNRPRIISFKKVGAAYRLLWSLSSNNNPYADWALIDLSHRRDGLQDALVKGVSELETIIEDLKARRGISFAVAKNQTPQKLPIRFRSPYGFAMVDTLAEFDYLVRLVRTLVFKGRVTVDQADHIIRGKMRLFRAHFNEVKKFEKYLGDPSLMLLTRNDFLGTADEVARKRVASCVELFGEVPRAVFNLEHVPPFKSHKSDLRSHELELLKQVAMGVSSEQDDAEVSALEQKAKDLL
jgi:integrating conjugative element protein (TIGR03761 family)